LRYTNYKAGNATGPVSGSDFPATGRRLPEAGDRQQPVDREENYTELSGWTGSLSLMAQVAVSGSDSLSWWTRLVVDLTAAEKI